MLKLFQFLGPLLKLQSRLLVVVLLLWLHLPTSQSSLVSCGAGGWRRPQRGRPKRSMRGRALTNHAFPRCLQFYHGSWNKEVKRHSQATDLSYLLADWWCDRCVTIAIIVGGYCKKYKNPATNKTKWKKQVVLYNPSFSEEFLFFVKRWLVNVCADWLLLLAMATSGYPTACHYCCCSW